MRATSFTPTEYWPTSPRSGGEGRLVFRMTNMLLRGSSARPYAEVYGGSKDLNEPVPAPNATGTINLVAGSKTVTGVGTAFKSELHIGQFLIAYGPTLPVFIHGWPIVVDEIIDNTHFTAHLPAFSSAAGLNLARLPAITEMNKKRVVITHGNAIQTDLGNIIAVGSGELRVNGTPLPGTSLIATKAPKVALFDGTNYSVFTLGLATPASLAAANGPAGTKNMQAGVYSIRAAEARLETKSYGNPSPKAEVTLVAGNTIRVTVPAITTGNAWVFFGSLFQQNGGINGPWYRVELPSIFVPVGPGAGHIPAAGGTYDIEYSDAELSANDLLTFNNNPPPDAEYVTWLGGSPVYISCLGPGETSPGPMIAAGRARNIEAVPPTQYISTSPPDTIVGFMVGVQGRLNLMCVNSLQIAVATQATDVRIPALAVRPFWRSGFPNPETLVSVGDNIIGMTTNGLARSISEGDEGTEEYNFATAVDELVQFMTPGHCLLKVDPKNAAIVLFHSGILTNEGEWGTRALVYSLRENKWVGDILLADNSLSHGMIVSSAAVVNGHLEFIAGGYDVNTETVIMRTYRWDEPTEGQTTPWAITWQLTDDGVEDRPKAVKGLRITGKLTSSQMGIVGARPGIPVDMPALETTSGGFGVSIGLADTDTVTEYGRVELDSDNWKQWAPKVIGVWDGVGNRDRIDEVVVESLVRGARK